MCVIFYFLSAIWISELWCRFLYCPELYKNLKKIFHTDESFNEFLLLQKSGCILLIFYGFKYLSEFTIKKSTVPLKSHIAGGILAIIITLIILHSVN